MEQRLKQNIHIGDTIRALRMEHHLTQEQVVAKLQLALPAVSTHRLNPAAIIYVSLFLQAYARFFHVDYNEFFRNIKLSDMEGTKQK